jgi:hypothetical protein
MSVEVFSLIIAILFALAVLELVRRRHMLENFALLWSLVAVGGLLLVFARPLVDRLTRAVGISTGASVVFAGGIVFLLLLSLYLSLQASRLATRVERLAEEVAFLRGVEPPPQDAPSDVDADADR